MVPFCFMSKNKDFSKYKFYYNNIGHVTCPALNNEIVRFNNQGFRHLLIKKRKWRKPKDQFRRLSLLKYAKSIVSFEKVSASYRVIGSKREIAQFWSLEMKIKTGTRVVVIIRQLGGGSKHFFSIFSKKD